MKTDGTAGQLDKARATLHKLRGASSTLGAEGIQHTCEAMRESIVNQQYEALRRGRDPSKSSKNVSGIEESFEEVRRGQQRVRRA